MAVYADALVACQLRFGARAIAQMTQRENYDRDNPNTPDEDVFDQAVVMAMAWVKQRVGSKDSDAPEVVEAVPIFLQEPGADNGAMIRNWEMKYSLLQLQLPATATTAVPATSPLSRRRYTGDQYYENLDIQSSTRPRRSGNNN